MLQLQCIDSYHNFLQEKDEVVDFINSFFPDLFPRSFCWIEAWWHTYEPEKKVKVYIVRNTSSREMVAMVPLMLTNANFGGFPMKKIEIIGRGIGNEDLPIKSHHRDCLELIFSHLNKYTTWHMAQFSRITNQTTLNSLTQIGSHRSWKIKLKKSKNYRINLEGEYDVYFNSRSKRFRQNYRTAKNRIAKEGDISFSHFPLIKSDQTPLKLGLQIAAKSWQYAEESSHFNERKEKCFYQNLVNSCNNQQAGEFWFINLEATPIAYMFTVLRGGIFYVVDVAFIEKYKQYSPGRILYCHVIEKIMANSNYTFLDFGGDGSYKKEYSSEHLGEASITVFNNTPYSRLVNWIRNLELYKIIKTHQRNKS